ncbi:MAG TPA: hypothetical protein PLV13_00115, partial [Ilumatobacteraceae bacterium]|nr:hypothetical protein [Ilumatobacteraceae bacterium]
PRRRSPSRDVTRQQTPSQGRTLPQRAPVTPTRQPTPVSGYQPVRAGRPAGSPVRADRTPPATSRPRQQPNRKYEHSNKPSAIIVGGLLLIAFVVGLVLWVTMGNDGGSTGALDTGTTLGLPDTAPVAQVTVPSLATSLSLHSFDPDGDGDERPEWVPNAVDGDPSTAWKTLCYDNQYLGGKGGVGLVLDLGAPRTGTLSVQIGSAPYQLKVYGAPEGAEPTTFAGWGSPSGEFDGQQTATESVTFSTPVRFVLVSFLELGRDPGCSDSRYRGAIQEVTFSE